MYFFFCWEKIIFVLTISSTLVLTLVLKHEKFGVWQFTNDDIYIIIPTISLPLPNSVTAMEAFSTMVICVYIFRQKKKW
jgi:hypothetical protein